MARDGNGKYKIPTNSWYPPVNGNQATAADFKKLIEDIADALTQSVSSDGQTAMQGPLNMGGNRVRGLAAPAGNNDALRRLQLLKGPEITPETISTIPSEGCFFEMVGTGDVEGFGAAFPGRLVWIGFSDDITLKNSSALMLIGGKDWTTKDGDYGLFLQINDEDWVCLQQAPADMSWSGITDKPTTFPSNWANVADKPDTATHWTAWPDVTGKPSTFPPSAHSHDWSSITSKPTTFPPIVGTQGNQAKAGNWTPDWGEVRNKPAIPPVPQNMQSLAIGSYSMMDISGTPSGFIVQNNATTAGSNLRCSGGSSTNTTRPSGTWRNMSGVNLTAGNGNNSIWLRVS